ncbi:MKI67 FHA domain-containing protein [Cinnamomum micranthum f. kanehirae]|uniref:MKI67 FHA domain-containing protein n=1 Tax=Cinnamomum micranthum f. kanehirae TaxID=337451 RepID=A0A3S3NUD5_9MAGN|nr:MKI67 FHA domain-containing protein [Cinnamomum micranthum f. kanehirae]
MRLASEMGAKKKALMKKIKKNSSDFVSWRRHEDDNYLPLEGGPARKLPEQEEPEKDIATVLYIGRVPHGFYEDEMEAFFKQFGKIKHLRIARNKKVAKIVADCMHNYLMFEHMLQVHLIPPERVHPRLWKARNYILHPPSNWTEVERKKHNKVKTVEEHQKLVQGILKRDKKRRKKIEAAGIDYECPEIVGSVQPAPKKIKFDEDDD